MYMQLTSTDFIRNEIAIIECARSFREDANILMNALAKDFNFSLEVDSVFPRDIYRHKYNNKGALRNDRTYYFHGAECRFDNLSTGQVVELIYVTKPEFGYLDGYFFYNYMVTTAKFKDLANWFGDSRNVWIAMETLADRDILTRDRFLTINRNIIAL